MEIVRTTRATEELLMWKLSVSDDERTPWLQRYMTGELIKESSMRPGKTAQDRMKQGESDNKTRSQGEVTRSNR